MPTYDYRCDACGHTAEIFHAMSDKPKSTCPSCRSRKFRRLIGAGAGVIFKGSGFYETDYRGGAYDADKKKDSDAPACTNDKKSCDAPACPKDD
jgi:putative FmdB family regulatory protein